MNSEDNFKIPLDDKWKSPQSFEELAKTDEELDTEFEALPPQMQDLVRTLGTEYGEEKREEMEQNITELFNKAPRKLKRKLKPQNKFSNQLLRRLAK